MSEVEKRPSQNEEKARAPAYSIKSSFSGILVCNSGYLGCESPSLLLESVHMSHSLN